MLYHPTWQSSSGPAWRAARAEGDACQDLNGLLGRSFDPLVRRYRSYRMFLRSRIRPPEAVKRLNYPMSLVDDIYHDVHPHCLRHAIEAATLARVDYPFYAEHLHPALTPEVVWLYHALFFDIADKFTVRFWIDDKVLAVADRITDPKMRESGFMWKMAAWGGGAERLLREGLRGSPLSREDFTWITNMTASETARRVLNRAHSSDRLLLEAGASAEAGVAKAWLDAKTSDADKTSAADGSALAGVGEAVASQLIMLEPGALVDAEERFEGTVKTY